MPAQSSPTRTSKTIAVLIVVGITAIVGIGIAQRLGSERERAEDRNATLSAKIAEAQGPREVAVASPVAFQFDPNFSITGTLDPVEQADVSFNVGGRLVSIDVALGEEVKAGQVLARLDRRSVSAQVQLASAAADATTAQLTLAEDRLQRSERLHAQGATSDAELLAAQQQVALARAQMAQAGAQTRLSSTDGANHVLKAPFAGTVTRVPDGVGGVVGPGQALFRVEDLSSLLLRSGITERALPRVRVGDAVSLDGLPVRGEVRAFARSLDPVTRRAPIEIAVPNPDGTLIGHVLVKGSILTERSVPALRIPGTAVLSDQSVLVVDAEGKIATRSVQVVIGAEGEGIVLDGLEEGARVVVRPTPDLTPGLLVHALEAAAEAPAAAAR